MANIQIKKVTIKYIDQLQLIGRKTFSETFSSENEKENMENYLQESFSIERLASEITDNNSEFYFASFENKLAGYLKVNFGPAHTELKDRKALEIERIYVLSEFQGKQVGQLLYEKAIYIAKQKKAEYVRLV